MGTKQNQPESNRFGAMKKVIFTNGCFDLLHPGHLTSLRFCASLGYVVVGLNSDESVRRLKGPQRPLMSEQERRFSLESCRWVDEVHIFDEDTPIELIRKVRPDVIVKGYEGQVDGIVGAELADVRLFRPIYDVSTSKLIERVVERYCVT